LPGEDEPANTRVGKLFELGRDELPSTPLRIQRLLHVVVELVDFDRTISVPFPPDFDSSRNRLTTHIALLSLTYSRDRVLTAEFKQRVTNPLGPLRKASKGESSLDASRQSAPSPNRQ
jgi:hypothetical protein